MDAAIEKLLKIVRLHIETKGVPPLRRDIDSFARSSGIPFKIDYLMSTRFSGQSYSDVLRGYGFNAPTHAELKLRAALVAKEKAETSRPTLSQFLDSIKKVAELLGHTPTPIQYDSMSKDGLALPGGFHNLRRLLAPEFPSYATFFIASGIPLPPAENMRLLEKVESLNLDKYRPEWVVPSSQFRVDFLIEHAGLTFGLEVDGSSHISPASKFHAAPFLNGGLTPDESFQKKRKRDVWVEGWFEENKTPLIRLSPVALYRINTAEELIERIPKTGFVSKLKVYPVTEKSIRALVQQGYTDGSLSEHFGMSKRAIGEHRRRYGIPSAYKAGV